MEIKRQVLLQQILNSINGQNYLEIGTFEGDSLLPLRCKKKIAVDPAFRIPRRKKIVWAMRNFCNLNNEYFEITSESFFEKKKELVGDEKSFDLIFIDGLHTFRASLNDVLNSLRYISRKGFIVLHDCFPPHEAAATPGKSAYEARLLYKGEWPGEWCGDVWKTIVYLKESFSKSMEISVINSDYGLGILKIKERNFDIKLNAELYSKIEKLNYSDLISKPEDLINLRNPGALEELLDTI